MSQLDSGSAIAALDDREIRVIRVDKWNCDVRIKELSAKGRIELARYQESHPNMSTGETVGILAAMGIVDDQGNLVYGLDKLDELLDRNMEALEQIGVAMIDLCKLGPDAPEEAEKNSDPTSGSDSATS